MKYIDLRSDTVTDPTPEMREAMFSARVGDDVYGDDPTVRELEEYGAAISGKEAALFVPSGTFGNQLSLLTHSSRGDEVILADDCHIVMHEAGASSVIAGVQLRTLQSNKGELNPDDIESKIRVGDDIHYPNTALICIENAHSNGRVLSLANMEAIHNVATKYKLPVHLDGARLFNAAAALNVEVTEITRYCHSVMFCLSKGLCAPVGSLLAGPGNFIARARRGRKLMGGGMRQAGFLAAAGLVALKKMAPMLTNDHQNALFLGQELSKMPGFSVNMDDIQINMVFFDISGTGYDAQELREKLLARGIKVNLPESGIMRFVTNYWVTREDIIFVTGAMREIIYGYNGQSL